MWISFPAIVIGGIVLVALGYFGRRTLAQRTGDSIEQKSRHKLDAAETKAKEIVLEAQGKAASVLENLNNEERERKSQLHAIETGLLHREELLDKKLAGISGEEVKVDELKAQTAQKLETLSGLTKTRAREELFRVVREKNEQELAQSLQKFDQERRDEVEKKSLEIITGSLQRYARSHVSELTTTAFPLSDEELKGKIIGREGRNIRALERATGVELVIDETPDSIVISSFDP